MKTIYTNEIKRAFNTLGVKLALLIGCGLSIWHVVSVIIPQSSLISYELSSEVLDPLFVSTGLFNNWMGNELFPVQSYIFYLSFNLNQMNGRK